MPLRIPTRRGRCLARLLIMLAPPLVLIGCGSVPTNAPPAQAPASRPAPAAKNPGVPVLPRAGSGRGGYYMDDGPGDSPPEGLLDTPDAEPRIEPYNSRNSRPYVVFGKTYTPITDERPFKQRGVGSWYGKKFHGQKTASGELYDMYKMTAAHPTLPIPSYVRVTNLSNGKQVIVRVNDRGPFHSSRIIDLSYTAALKLGYLGHGSSQLEVERLLPEEIARMANAKKEQLARGEPVLTPEAPSAMAAQATPGVDIKTVSMTGETSAFALPQSVVVAAPVAASASGFYLQLGAYAQSANAEAARARLEQGAAGRLAPMEVVEYASIYRVYSGPFATRAEAAMAALRLQEGGIIKPVIVQR